ncbi:transcriptional repressor LexA [Bacillus sp. B-jedd]|uniref:transcriptional repressor LexA n=1 Tax=Bacillus sp. B-jedd TaxID=1476857 RepID=UPI0005156D79|nr:transcriptional repressor LexA [Bacillus sp. B-jedd]CEG29602.1 SOS-response transcriptional repressor [Bacillus sp. B-jedd]
MDQKEFGEYLRSLRQERKLTIRQLEALSGVSNAYLSQMENGKRGIPTVEILKKIHTPLGVSFDELMLKAGYISSDTKEKLTPEVIDMLNNFEVFSELLSNAADVFISSVTDNTGNLHKEYKEYLIEEAPEEYKSNPGFLTMFEDQDIFREMFERLTLEEKVIFLNKIIKDFVDQKIDPKVALKSKPEEISKVKFLKVPILGHIAAGQPIFAEDHIDDWTEIPDMWNLKPGEAFVLKVKGDSMIGSRIYDGDRVVVKVQPEVENGEIAVVNVNGDEATLKRVKRASNGQIILYPDNPRYEPTFVNNEKARIVGKVIQVMFEPKRV